MLVRLVSVLAELWRSARNAYGDIRGEIVSSRRIGRPGLASHGAEAASADSQLSRCWPAALARRSRVQIWAESRRPRAGVMISHEDVVELKLVGGISCRPDSRTCVIWHLDLRPDSRRDHDTAIVLANADETGTIVQTVAAMASEYTFGVPQLRTGPPLDAASRRRRC
jgi:hypothetical protein